MSFILLFSLQDGMFSVPITAALPEADLLLPDKLDFGLCAVGDHKQQLFEIINIRCIPNFYMMNVEKL